MILVLLNRAITGDYPYMSPLYCRAREGVSSLKGEGGNSTLIQKSRKSIDFTVLLI